MRQNHAAVVDVVTNEESSVMILKRHGGSENKKGGFHFVPLVPANAGEHMLTVSVPVEVVRRQASMGLDPYEHGRRLVAGSHTYGE